MRLGKRSVTDHGRRTGESSNRRWRGSECGVAGSAVGSCERLRLGAGEAEDEGKIVAGRRFVAMREENGHLAVQG